MKRAVVVFSGGQDSTTCLIQAKREKKYDEIYCITFDYGQCHREEIEVAKKLARQFEVQGHKILDTTLLNELTTSSLMQDSISTPIHNRLNEKDGEENEENSEGGKPSLPSTFVPGRNILFLTLAAIYAYQVQANAVISGVCQTDFSGYPDCRDEFIKSLNGAIKLGINRDISFTTPLMWLDKAETWALADYYQQLNTVRNSTLTCYNGTKSDGCGTCAACHLRSRGLNRYLADREKVMASLKKKTGLS